ncbi:MAG: precorrin-6A reductase [Propionibacterium sp.]|nr:MAG: precorrin-6A reductase [Propionibacterium sp.]
MKILLLGGTSEARALAPQLLSEGHQVISSLAGRVDSPLLPDGEVRIGGFGGVSGLASYLRQNQIELVIDATHPFAEQISANAVLACEQTKTQLVRRQRPSWIQRPDSTNWTWVSDHDEAFRACLASGAKSILLTVGRQPLPHYLDLDAEKVIARVADLGRVSGLPTHWKVIEDRGPFTIEKELKLFSDKQIKLLVTKDSGSAKTAAKLDAAAKLGVQVIMVARSILPDLARPN